MFSLIVTFHLTKTASRTKKSLIQPNTSLTLLLQVKILFQPKNADFLQRNADDCKIKKALVVKGIITETAYVCVPTLKFLA